MTPIFRISNELRELALHALDFPIALVCEDGRVEFLNKSAVAWLAKNGVISIHNHYLVGSHLTCQSDLEALYRDAKPVNGARKSNIHVFPHADGGKPYLIISVPLEQSGINIEADCEHYITMLVVSDQEDPLTLRPERMQALFGLTPAEAKVACSLAKGKSLEKIAAEDVLSINTIRTQVKQAMSKTGSHRQTELVLMLSGLPKVKLD